MAEVNNATQMNDRANIYTEHFGLRERPFSLVPDPYFLYWSEAHRRAFAILEYGVTSRAPITLFTGEVGTGKTTLLRQMLAALDGQLTVGLVSNAQGGRGDLLRWVLSSVGQPGAPRDTYVELFARLERFLIEEYAQGRRVVLIFDEAQNLPRDSIEELRMLTNINSNKDELVQLVLVGQPELRDLVTRKDMSQFAQRVGATFHLEPMDGPAVEAYIRHRLAVAGARREIFDPAAAELVRKTSHGVPRLINQVCDLSMVYAFASGALEVTRETVQQVLNDGLVFSAGPIPVLPSLPRARKLRGLP